jgi:hypothetical protein
MPITLGNLTFTNKLYFDNEIEWTGIAESAEMTLGGGIVIYGGEVSGRPIDLIGEEIRGWIKYSELKMLREMASESEATYSLNYDGDTYTVRFRHEDSPVLEMTPIIRRVKYKNDDWFYGTIKLMEVGEV